MFCVTCDVKMHCLDSRWVNRNRQQRRRLECPICLDRITTREFDEKQWSDLLKKFQEQAEVFQKKIKDIIKALNNQ